MTISYEELRLHIEVHEERLLGKIAELHELAMGIAASSGRFPLKSPYRNWYYA